MIGWTIKDGLWVNDGVAGMAHAQERGGWVGFNPETLETSINPWSDGTAASLKFSPLLPFGVSVGTPVELEHGWRYPCSGPLSAIEVVDLQLTNRLSYLREFGGEGLKVIWWMDAAKVKDDGGGFWRPKRSAVTGPGPFEAYQQPEAEHDYDELGEIVGTRPFRARGAIMYYGAEGKQHVVKRPDGSIKHAYHNGKIWEAPRPTALFWSATGALLGVVYGLLEWDTENKHEVKAYPLAECMAFVNGGAVSVSVDATIGYTSVPSTLSTARISNWYGFFTASETFTVNKGKFYVGLNATFSYYMAIYNNGADTPIGQSPVSNSKSDVFPSQFVNTGNWVECRYSGAKPTLTLDSTYQLAWFVQSGSLPITYDAATGTADHRRNSITYSDPPDPCPAGLSAGVSNAAIGIYFEGTSSGGGGGNFGAVHLNNYRRRF